MIPLALLLFLFGIVLSFVGATVFARAWVLLSAPPESSTAEELLRQFILAWVLAVAVGLATTAAVIGAAYMRGVDLGRMVG